MESRQIKDFEDYIVFSNGFIMNKRGRFLKPVVGTHGYLQVSLCKNNKVKNCRIHRLVCDAFHENPENKKCVDHIDHNKQNNWKSNLRWASDSENQRNHPKRDNTLFRGVFLTSRNNWRASYYDSDGKEKAKSFSVNKYGNKEALKLAVNWRYQAEIDYDYTILQTPEQLFESDAFLNL